MHSKCKIIVIGLCFANADAYAACDLSHWLFSSYQTLSIGQITIEDGTKPAGGILLAAETAQSANTYNISSVWKNSGTGDIHSSSLTKGGSVDFYYVTSYYTGEDPSCRISIKPRSTLSSIIAEGDEYQWYFQKQFSYGGEIMIPAGCTPGLYKGDITIEAHIVDPVYCPDGGVVRSSFPSEISINEVKAGATLTVQSRADLDFGVFLSPQIAGTVKINASSDTPLLSGINGVNTSQAHRGEVLIKGVAGTQYSVILPSDIILTNNTNNQLNVSDLHTSYTNKTLDTAGYDVLYIGGTLNVPAHAYSGEYEGTYTIQISY